ncbi:hypothetical protein [Arthrobacter sp. KNU40]|uniref:hypothetical protein n=1 Tax=Arthrobacter sp. KNU40 TaxID=3447965 RepID=UPI003F6277C6
MLYLDEVAVAVWESGTPGPDGIVETDIPAECGRLIVLRAATPPSGETEIDFVAGTVAGLLDRLRSKIYGDGAANVIRVALVVEEPKIGSVENRALNAALGEASRGIAQSLARELGPSLRINSILCDQAVAELLAPTLSFLGSEAANFVTGSTIDLRSAT